MKFAGRTATAIITFPPDKILLIKRATVPFKGYWALPGGRVNPGETVEHTVVREVKEETGLIVEITSKLGDYHEQGVQGGVEYDYYPACFLVKIVGGEIKKQESEIEEIRLFSLNEIPEALAFEHTKMVKDYVATQQTNVEIPKEKFDVEQIYELANKVLSKLGKQVQADVECWWTQYEDEHILIHYGGGYYDNSFRVYQKQEAGCAIVLETHLVRRKITNKIDLLRDMLHHGFCDDHCPGHTHAVSKRAYEIYLKRGREPHHELDDWLQAEAEILEELLRKFPGDWEVATLKLEHWGPVPCVILRRGEWVEHLKSLASTL